MKKLCEVLDVDVDTLLGFKSEDEKIKGISGMVAKEIMQNPIVKEIEIELSKMSDVELKRLLRMTLAAKDEE